MSNLLKRVFSAIAIIIVSLGIHWYWGPQGVFLLGAVLCALGAWEYKQLAFSRQQTPNVFQYWFLTICLTLIFITLFTPDFLGTKILIFWGILLTTFISVSLWLFRNSLENRELLQILSISLLGFLYCALLPAPALLLFRLPDGQLWFVFLLAVVFFGDVFAYFGGRWFGNKKLMPNLSPNKTVAGAVAGLLGSLTGGLMVAGLWLGDAPLLAVTVVALFAAFLAQNGDLFESLIKRVANVKDSGRFMPGHGGVLDRLDGIFFAAPLVYALADFLQ